MGIRGCVEKMTKETMNKNANTRRKNEGKTKKPKKRKPMTVAATRKNASTPKPNVER